MSSPTTELATIPHAGAINVAAAWGLHPRALVLGSLLVYLESGVAPLLARAVQTVPAASGNP